MRFFCLINPVSGGMKGKAVIAALEALRAAGKFEGEIEELNQKGVREQLTRAKTFDRILAAGGDGTIAEIISSMDETHPPLGLLPLGTGNDLAKEIGIFSKFSISKIENILDFYKTAPTKPLAVWKLLYGKDLQSSVKFINYVSFGMDAGIVRKFSSWRKSKNYRHVSKFGIHGNRMAYAAAGVMHSLSFLKLGSLKVRRDSVDIKLPAKTCRTMIFTNIKSMMGIGVSNKRSSFFDDKIELVLATSVINYLAMILRLKAPLPAPKLVESGSIWEIENMDEATAVQVDGESRPDIVSASYRIEAAGNIRILTACDS